MRKCSGGQLPTTWTSSNSPRKFAGDFRGTQVGTDMYGIMRRERMIPNPGFGPGWSDAGVVFRGPPGSNRAIHGSSKKIGGRCRNCPYLPANQAANPDYLWRRTYGIRFGDWLCSEGSRPRNSNRDRLLGLRCYPDEQMAQRHRKVDDERKYADLSRKNQGRLRRRICARRRLYRSFRADNTPVSLSTRSTNPDAKSQGGERKQVTFLPCI